ncbi:MAG: hypothetical protein ABIC91_03325 [Nanoarchaeota archaeon]|nr:hypothetical protein [Nanoarchaeota archaeon]MBU1030044.1 hypothetical protein [Nanoarchaeota archaeon]MBU1850133.1 hypothetical protein [Nanoarchaeota archaeon]
MAEDELLIKIIQSEKKSKILGISIPFTSHLISNGFYSSTKRTSRGVEGAMNPLDCLVSLLVNAELNRDDKKQLGPIHATFKLLGDDEYYASEMEEILNIYARSEKTTVKFEYIE